MATGIDKDFPRLAEKHKSRLLVAGFKSINSSLDVINNKIRSFPGDGGNQGQGKGKRQKGNTPPGNLPPPILPPINTNNNNNKIGTKGPIDESKIYCARHVGHLSGQSDDKGFLFPGCLPTSQCVKKKHVSCVGTAAKTGYIKSVKAYMSKSPAVRDAIINWVNAQP